MNTTQTKTPLSECKELIFDNGRVSMFRMNGKVPSQSGKIRVTVPCIGGWQTDYKSDTMVAKEFMILAHATDNTGVEIKINEEMLQQMLDYIKAEKQKTYCIEGST